MFGSTVLEVAAGLTFCYATVALIASTLQEALASATNLRARTLLSGIKSMLNDARFDALARALYSHALINPHDDDSGTHSGSPKTKPAYIKPANFAIALVDTIQSVPGDFAQLGRDIDALPDPQVRRALQSMYRRATGDIERFQASVAGWFETAMERIDQGALDALRALPVGWQSFPPKLDQAFALKMAGWMLTASTALFGAAFWFDLLQRTVHVRGTGPKPEERAQDKSAGAVSVDQQA